jgi:uncharacterized membrane protein YedE/YeeE
VSGLTDTSRVRGFPDFYGTWDPTLVFVICGTLVPMGKASRLTPGRAPLTGGTVPSPGHGIGKPLIIGSALYGIGWGLVGHCPAAALAVLAYGAREGLTFLVAMLVRMWIASRWCRVLDRGAASP